MNDRSTQRSRLVRLVPALSVLLVIGIAVVFVLLLKNWLGDKPDTPKKMVQQVTIIAPPPPPPPQEEPPPEPEVEEQIEPEPEPMAEDTPDDSSEPPGADLGVDADGAGSGDGFGLVGKKGGRGLLDGSPFAWYEGLMVSEIQDLLANIDELRSTEYVIRIKLKVDFDGSVHDVQMLRSSGDKEKDRMLMAAISDFVRFSQMPPAKMPRVVDLKITSSI